MYAAAQDNGSTSYVDGLCRQVFESLYASRLDERRRHIREMKARASRGTTSPHTSGPRRRSAHPELPSLDHRYIQELEQLCYGFSNSTRGASLHLDRALVHLAYAHGQYERAHYIIREMAPFVPAFLETELETIWDHSSYHIYGSNLLLNSVNKYRIRKRVVCPTVLKSGGKKYKLSRDANSHLSKQFALNPKPERSTREQLSNLLGISMSTISNWFKNRRQRVRCDLINTLCNSSDISSVTSTQLSDTSSIVCSPCSQESTSPTSKPHLVYEEPQQQVYLQHQQPHQVIYYIPPEQLVERPSAPTIIHQMPSDQAPKIEYIGQELEQLCCQPVTCKSEPVAEEMVNTVDQWYPTGFYATAEHDFKLFDDLIHEMKDPCQTLDFCY